MFPRARKLMDKDELQTLGEQLARRKQELKAADGVARTAAAKRTRKTERARPMRRGWAAGLLAMALFAATPVAAEPVKVRLKEGNSRGFLALRPPGGDPIALASWARTRGQVHREPAPVQLQGRLALRRDGDVLPGSASSGSRPIGSRSEDRRSAHGGRVRSPQRPLHRADPGRQGRASRDGGRGARDAGGSLQGHRLDALEESSRRGTAAVAHGCLHAEAADQDRPCPGRNRSARVRPARTERPTGTL